MNNGYAKDGWLTKQYIDERFEYFDGSLLWKERPRDHFKTDSAHKRFNTIHKGKVAGTINLGYCKIGSSKERNLLAHRVIFFIHHGYLPSEIDHIDGNSLNNKIENLRPATRSQNLYNMNPRNRSKTGVRGIYFRKDRYVAYICFNKKQKYLGSFRNIEDAIDARKAAEKVFHGEFANER